jgi:hypothetical protein
MNLIGCDLSDPVIPGRQHTSEPTQVLVTSQLTGSQLYRTYVVYQDWRVLILPGLLMLGESACGWGLLVGTFQLSTGAFTAPSVAKWELSYITLALALNVLCTGVPARATQYLAVADSAVGLIAVQILRTSRAVAGCVTSSSKLFNNVARVLVETGLVYTAHTLLITVLTARRSLVLYPAAESVGSSVLPHTFTRADPMSVHPNDGDLLPPYHYPHGTCPAAGRHYCDFRTAVRVQPEAHGHDAEHGLVYLGLGRAKGGGRCGDDGTVICSRVKM